MIPLGKNYLIRKKIYTKKFGSAITQKKKTDISYYFVAKPHNIKSEKVKNK